MSIKINETINVLHNYNEMIDKRKKNIDRVQTLQVKKKPKLRITFADLTILFKGELIK